MQPDVTPALSFAPMEGITTHVFRRLHAECFSGVNRYYTPFLTPLKQDKKTPFAFKKRDLTDVLPENNEGLHLIPQVLCNRADAFLFSVEKLLSFGYREINLNLGCPMPTVVTKHKGAGFLEDTDDLDAFFEEVFRGLEQQGYTLSADSAADYVQISVKTRLGLRREEEARELVNVFNRYPFHEVIVHARLREDYYEGAPRIEAFEQFFLASRNPTGYNGDINTVDDYQNLMQRLKSVNVAAIDTTPPSSPGNETAHTLSSVMMGRGLLTNPALAREIKGGAPLKKEELRVFLDRYYEETLRVMPEEGNVLRRMKGLWVYLG
ncbi:MAG: tRNA-dihydrouridine synthase family protein, partial [Lachnospiraceae bacterium]|nr:tRNA-dihydrouridine synthase family protein [Lachnospiraceae bacterium]